MKEQFIIKYIKNGQEYTITNKLQYFLHKKRIFNNTSTDYKMGVYDVLKDVELIHIKNAHFENNFKFECYWNKKIIVILENCTFDCHNVAVDRGCFEFINCTFNESQTNKVETWICQEISIKGNGNTKINNLFIENAEKVNLENITIERNLRIINCDNVNMNNVETTNSFVIDTNECLEINNSLLESINSRKSIIGKQIKIKNSKVTGESLNIDCENLTLEGNSKVEAKDTLEFSSPNLKEIRVDDNSHLKGKNIQFEIHLYKNENGEPFIINKNTINNIWFQRKNLISVLKEIKIKYAKKIFNKIEEERKEEIKVLNEKEAKKIEIIKKLKEEELLKLNIKLDLKKKYKSKTRIKNL